MNKKIILGIAGLATLTLLCGCTETKKVEETTDEESTTTAVHDEVSASEFLGSWSSVRPTVDISTLTDTTYKVLVNWGSSATESTQWDYICNFDKDNHLMYCNGTKTDFEYTNDTDFTTSEVKRDQRAEFTIKDGKLNWNEIEEDQGKDIEFDKD